MSGSENGTAITLAADEAAMVRRALTSATGLLARVRTQGGPCLQLLQAAALEVICDGRPLNQVHHDLRLAVDCIDFAAPARRRGMR